MTAGAGGDDVDCAATSVEGAVCRRPSGHDGEHDSCDYTVAEDVQGGLVWL